MNLLVLLTPLGLLAMAALAVPLLIHLFSRSRGRRVLVGNIALYRQARRQRVTEPRLVQWLLLALRLALLALAALLLAGLARQGLETLPGDTLYVTPDWAARAGDDGAFVTQAEESLAAADQAFWLAPGYPTFTDATLSPNASAGTDSWTGLAERLATVRHEGQVTVLAVGDAAAFAARAPALPREVRWLLSEPGPAAPLPSIEVTLVTTPQRHGDAAVIGAALQAAAHHRALDIAVRTATQDRWQAIPGGSTGQEPGHRIRALVWLADGDLPDAAAMDIVLGDSPRPGARRTPAVLPDYPGARFLAAPAAPGNGRVTWRDDAGAALLVRDANGDQRRYRYLDRLGVDPDGLAGQASFPDALLRLLLGETAWSAATAHAAADPSFAVARPGAAGALPHRPLAPWLALAMALLFGLERWLSERPRRGAAR